MKIRITNHQQELYCGAIANLSPLGFSIEVGLSESQCFRDSSGRFICFDIELELLGGVSDGGVTGKAMVQSVRRISQQQNSLMIRFMNLEQGAYRTIAESLTTPASVSSTNSSHSHFPQQLAG